MLGLGIDTTGSSCALALWADDNLEYAIAKNMSRGYAETLIPMVDRALLDTGHIYKDIDVVGVATGPGSFTGLRVGLSAARGLSLGLNCPLHGVTTFYAAALASVRIPESKGMMNLLVILNSRRSQFYTQKFQLRKGSVEAVGPPELADESSILKNLTGPRSIITGDGAMKIRLSDELARNIQIIPDCRKSSVALIAKLAVKRGASHTQTNPNALYINPPSVTLA